MTQGYKTLSIFESENKKKDALVILNLDTKRYLVSMKNDFGTHFYSEFDSLESAKQFAEEWVK